MTETHNGPAPEPNDLLWGAAAIAAFLGRPVRGTFWHLERGNIPATKVGRVWTATRSALREHLGMRGAA
jgi:hypothetical protein